MFNKGNDFYPQWIVQIFTLVVRETLPVCTTSPRGAAELELKSCAT